MNKLCLLWGQPECDVYINRLILDSRDGKRQGLPWEAAMELLFLVELSIAKRALAASTLTGMPFSQMFRRCLAQACAPAADPWADPAVSTEPGWIHRQQA